MSAASVLNRLVSNRTPKLRTHQNTSVKGLNDAILNHLKANNLQKAVSVLVASPLPAPDYLYARLFQLCSSNLAINEARKVQIHLLTFSPTPPIFLLNRAIEAYGKCGCLADAKDLFDKMPKRDGGSWNVMIKAYIQCGISEKAVNLFKDMHRLGFSANEITFVSVLGLCGDLLGLSLLKQIHGLIKKYGFYGNLILGSSLVDVYGKCRAMNEARMVFEEIENRNDVTWNVIVRRYLEVGDEKEAVNMFFKMFHSDVRPLSFTFSNALIACSGMRAPEEGMQIHGVAIKINFEGDEAVLCSLCDMYAKCGEIENARRVFDQPGSRDLVSWTSMVSAYAISGRTREAREIFSKMPKRNVISWNAMLAGYTRFLQWEEALDFVFSMLRSTAHIDHVTIGLMLNVCAGLSDVQMGKQVHGYIYRHGFNSNILVGNALLDMYGKCGNLKSARLWFYQMRQLRDSVSWNVLLASYARHGLSEQVMTIFGEMKWETQPSKFTFGTLLAACANIFALNQGKQIHGFMIRNGYNIENITRGALVDMYSKCRCIAYALTLFREAESRDLVLYNSIILGCCHNRRGEEALQLLGLMEKEGVKPDHITFQGILLACLQEGFVELSKQYFNSMSSKYCIIPRLEHYECMVELFCQYGYKNELKNFIRDMPFDPTVSMLTRVLDASGVYGYPGLGKWAAERLKEMSTYQIPD